MTYLDTFEIVNLYLNSFWYVVNVTNYTCGFSARTHVRTADFIRPITNRRLTLFLLVFFLS